MLTKNKHRKWGQGAARLKVSGIQYLYFLLKFCSISISRASVPIRQSKPLLPLRLCIPFSLRAHDTCGKRVSQRFTENRGFLEYPRFLQKGRLTGWVGVNPFGNLSFGFSNQNVIGKTLSRGTVVNQYI